MISPLLLNVALHGLEEAAGVRYRTGVHAGEPAAGSPVLTDTPMTWSCVCHSRQQAEQVKARLAEWLEPRGLAFNEAKTRIVHLTEGFDFLGFNVRRYPNGKLLIKPSATAIKRFRERLAEETVTARVQRRGGTGQDRPDHPGLGRLLPDGGVTRVFAALTDTCGSCPISGHDGATRTSPGAGSSPGTSASSASSGMTSGYSATETPAATWPNCPGPTSCGTPGHRRGIPR